MGKYIDADKLAIDLQHRCDVICPYTKAQRDVMCRACLLGDAIDTVEDQPAVDIEPRWIPVTERLPDINDHYTSDVCLVYCDNGAYAFAELEENIFGQVGWDCEREDDYHEAVGSVIAWMPLPEPYKEGEQNG